MIKQYQLIDIDNNTKLVRFLDLNGAKKSLGALHSFSEIHCTYHYGLLSYYRSLETDAGDARDGLISVSLANGIKGRNNMASDALISCWSIWDGKNDPWHSFRDGNFVKNEDYICAIVSTVGKVKNIFQKIIEINKLLLGNNFSKIVIRCVDKPVNYYSEENGVSHNDWIEDTDTYEGMIRTEIQNIFYKRDSNEKRQRYDVECEYRFAVLLSSRRFFINNIAMNAVDSILHDYSLILTDDTHYIEKIYLRPTGYPEIEEACRSMKIELV